MKRNILIMVMLVMVSLATMADEKLNSPDGKYTFSFIQQYGRLAYSLSYEGKTVVETGSLGVQVDNHLVESAMGIPVDSVSVWTSDLMLTGVDRSGKDEVWQPVYGEFSSIRNHYNELVLHFKKGGIGDSEGGYNKRQQYLFDIIVRAYNEGIAIRYHFPEATNGLFMHITDELTSFTFAPGTEAFYEAWAQGPYNKVKLLKSETAWKDESERPLVLELPNGLYAAVAEAGLYDFVRGKLKLKADNELQMSMFQSADVITAYDMPWRVIMAGDKAVDLINNKQIILNLNAPDKIKNTSWIKPGKVFRVSQLNMKSALECVDFAVSRGLQYIELDAGWYGPEMQMSSSALKVASNRDIEMPELCRYARSKGVGVWLYVNQRALSQQLDSILPLYEKWGVSGIKFGFVQIGAQTWTTWLHKAVEQCAEHHLMVDIHDEYRPTGWSRTYPNLMTQEGIGGNEEMPDAQHNTILPYTRFLCGPADYTLCYYNGRVKNTKAHQLAMSVVYYSPITFMYWYDRPDVYKGEKELDFWKDCPTVWDYSKALSGEIGEYIVQVRKSGNDWFAGAMTKEKRNIVINTSEFLQKGKSYEVEIYNDSPSLNTRTRVSCSLMTVKAGKKIMLQLQQSGGAALHFKLKK